MRNKKIIKLPKRQMVGIAKDFGLGNLILCPDHFAFSLEDLNKLLEQTFNAGVDWKEKYTRKIKLKDSNPAQEIIPNFEKYLKQIQ